MFISQITQEDIDRSSTLEQKDLGLYCIYSDGAIISTFKDYYTAMLTFKMLSE